MDQRLLRRVAERALVMGVVVMVSWTEVAALLPIPVTSIAEASVTADKHDDGKDKKDSKKKDDDKGEDFVLNGQVLEIDTHKDPPEMIVGTVDGRTRVRVLKTDEIARNGVRIGDSVELTGEKINELLFETTEISVSERLGGPGADDNGSDEDDSGDESDSP